MSQFYIVCIFLSVCLNLLLLYRVYKLESALKVLNRIVEESNQKCIELLSTAENAADRITREMSQRIETIRSNL